DHRYERNASNVHLMLLKCIKRARGKVGRNGFLLNRASSHEGLINQEQAILSTHNEDRHYHYKYGEAEYTKTPDFPSSRML
ncbi:MAG: hypothetical protein KJ645_05255, partial [Planctomycetes bacterium]|nr:hypothetical protein [Planctomycetota bacterium]